MEALPGNPFKGISMLDLPGGKPDVADHDVIEDSAFEAFTSTLKGPPAARGGRYKLHLPSLSDVASALCPSRANGHLLVRIGPAPEVYRRVPLQHHVTTQNLRQAHLRTAFETEE